MEKSHSLELAPIKDDSTRVPNGSLTFRKAAMHHSLEYHLSLYNPVGVAFSGGSTLNFRPSDFGAKRLPSSTILERSRGGASATILRSDYVAVHTARFVDSCGMESIYPYIIGLVWRFPVAQP
jgi:hypothetical protein